MPLAANGGRIASVLKRSGKHTLFWGQTKLVLSSQANRIVVAANISQADRTFKPADALLIAASHQARSRRRAFGTVGVKAGQTHAFPGQGIDISCADVRAAVAPEVAITHIVGHNQ